METAINSKIYLYMEFRTDRKILELIQKVVTGRPFPHNSCSPGHDVYIHLQQTIQGYYICTLTHRFSLFQQLPPSVTKRIYRNLAKTMRFVMTIAILKNPLTY